MQKVVIIQRALPHYRVPFFESLRLWLAQHGVELQLIYGKPEGAEALKKDARKLEWATEIANITLTLGPAQLVWQPVLGHLKGASLVVAEQANRNLVNFMLMAGRKLGGPRFALWGHGRNRQAGARSLGNKLKNQYLHWADWWFAYTEGVKQDLIAAGYPAGQITAVGNSIDTRALAADFESISKADAVNHRRRLTGIDEALVGLFCGGMYPEKQIPFLLEAALDIKRRVPQFHLLAVGSGTDAPLFEEFARQHPWVHYLGPRFGREKALAFAASTLCLMPGLVGLGVLDSFVCRRPMVTTRYPYHSPEIDYLHDGDNGIITDNNTTAFADAVTALLQSPATLLKLQAGCAQSAPLYTIEQMAENFGRGILAVLG